MAISVSYTTDPVTGELQGNLTEQMSTSGGVVSSNDFTPENAVRVVEGSSQYVSDINDLNVDDVIMYQGMQVKVGILRDLGLLDDAWLENSENVLAAQREREAYERYHHTSERTQVAPTTEYEAAEQSVAAALDEEVMTIEEAQMAVNALGNAELAGMPVGVFAEAAMGVLTGIDEMSLRDMVGTGDRMSMVQTTVAQMQPIMEQSAKAEIGEEAFAWLQRMAETSPAVAKAIVGYGVQRAIGQTGGATWSDLHDDVKAFLRGAF